MILKRLLLLLALLSPVSAASTPSLSLKVLATTQTAGAAGSFAVDGQIFAASDSALYTLNGGRLVRRDPRTFEPEATTRETDLGGVVVAGGPRVYALNKAGAVAAFDAHSLARRWTVTLATPPQQLLPAGEVLLAVRPTTLTALDARTGRVRYTLHGTDPDHQAVSAQVVGGVLLVHHAPAEGFQGEVYTAHDPLSSRQLWRQDLGHGYVLGQLGQNLVFDTRDWHNLLGPRGAFRLTEVDFGSGRRREAARSLAGLPGTPASWTVVAGTPTLGSDGTLWLVLEARAGGTRLARVGLDSALRLWALPSARPGSLDGTALALTRGNVVVVSPSGVVTTLNLAHQTTRSVTLPGFSGALTLTPLGEVVAVTRAGGGAVILSPAGQVRLRTETGGVPVRIGMTLFVPPQRGLTAFHLP